MTRKRFIAKDGKEFCRRLGISVRRLCKHTGCRDRIVENAKEGECS